MTPTTNIETKEKIAPVAVDVVATKATEGAKSAYVSPAILSHSAEKTEENAHPVSACTSFIP